MTLRDQIKLDNLKHWLRNLFGCDLKIFGWGQPQPLPQTHPHPQPQPQQQLQPDILQFTCRGGEAFPYNEIVKCMAVAVVVAVAVAVAVSGGGAVAVAMASLTKCFWNHIQKDSLINVWR